MRDTDKDWTTIAETDPYWGVLSVEDFRGEELSDGARQIFFDSGKAFVENTFAFIRRHIDAGFAPARSLDFGCGVGRLLIPIAAHSTEAIGLDIAPRMREIAEANLRSVGVRNARVLASDDLLSQAEGEFDFVNSFIVLQHIPPERGTVLLEQNKFVEAEPFFREALEKLKNMSPEERQAWLKEHPEVAEKIEKAKAAARERADNLTPEQKEKLKAKLKERGENLTPEQKEKLREKMKERFDKMTPEQKEELLKKHPELKEKLDGGKK